MGDSPHITLPDMQHGNGRGTVTYLEDHLPTSKEKAQAALDSEFIIQALAMH